MAGPSSMRSRAGSALLPACVRWRFRHHRRSREAQERRRGERADGSLHEEDRAPVEQLRQNPAEGRPGGGAEHGGGGPQPLPVALAGGQEGETADQPRGRAERL